jgi:hypothetical protein
VRLLEYSRLGLGLVDSHLQNPIETFLKLTQQQQQQHKHTTTTTTTTQHNNNTKLPLKEISRLHSFDGREYTKA